MNELMALNGSTPIQCVFRTLAITHLHHILNISCGCSKKKLKIRKLIFPCLCYVLFIVFFFLVCSFALCSEWFSFVHVVFSNYFVRAYHMRSQLDWFSFRFVCLFVVKLFLIDESSLCPQCLHKVLFFRYLHFVTNLCVSFFVSFFCSTFVFLVADGRNFFVFVCMLFLILFVFVSPNAFNIFYLHVTFKFVCMFCHVPW